MQHPVKAFSSIPPSQGAIDPGFKKRKSPDKGREQLPVFGSSDLCVCVKMSSRYQQAA
jgi:hypothetical protein